MKKRKNTQKNKRKNKQKQSKITLPKEKPLIKSLNYGVRVYDLETKRSLEEIIEKSKVKAQYNLEARNYTQLIENFEVPIACSHMALTNDLNHLFVAGTYPPQIKCFELDQLSQKFERHVAHDIIRMIPISDDFRKIALLEECRYLEFHASGGYYHKFRIPKAGRDMTLHTPSAELLIAGSGNEIFRFNMEEGIYKQPYQLASDPDASNVVKVNPVHQLIAVGCENGYIECFDHRSKTHVGILDACTAIKDFMKYPTGDEVTALAFDTDGISMAVGNNTGQIGLFDLRKPIPILVKDHNYDDPIVQIEYHDITKNIFSADKRVVKIWDKTNGENYTNIELQSTIHSMLIYPNSGMLFVAGERKKIKPLYIPSLGQAPKWCSFVDNITEELEEIKKFTVYQDYKFVTLEELKDLGLEDLIGSEMLRPYGQGYFMKLSLYKKALQVKGMQVEDENKDEILEKQVEKRWGSERLPKELIDEIKKEKPKPIEDDRFNALITDPDFEINENVKKKKTKKSLEYIQEMGFDADDNVDDLYEMELGKTLSYKKEEGKKSKLSFAKRLEEEKDKVRENMDSVYGSKEMVVELDDEPKRKKQKKEEPKKEENETRSERRGVSNFLKPMKKWKPKRRF